MQRKQLTPPVFLIVLLLLAGLGCGQSGQLTKAEAVPVETNPYSWENYQPNTLADITEEVLQGVQPQNFKNNDLYLETSPAFQHLSIVNVVYSGDCHPVPKVRSMMIDAWAGSMGVSSMKDVEEQYLYETECLFLEDSTEYWLPVQNLLLSIFQEKIANGGEIKLFVLWMGVAKVDDSLDLVFLINNIMLDDPAN